MWKILGKNDLGGEENYRETGWRVCVSITLRTGLSDSC
jgi:hypothetical protein